jgi:hypothetical protein
MWPCQLDPDAWFGYEETFNGTRSLEQWEAVTAAKHLCATECPLTQRRQCAATALEVGASYGIWAGVELRGQSKSNLRAELRAGRVKLKAIADGKHVEENLRPARRRPSGGRLRSA